MKRFSEISKSSLVRHWFDELPVGARFNSHQASVACGISISNTAAAIAYLVKVGAAQIDGRGSKYVTYKKLSNSRISDHQTKRQPERVIVRRKQNVIYPQNFSADENVNHILAANRALKDQLRAKMDEILNTLSTIDELLKEMKSE